MGGVTRRALFGHYDTLISKLEREYGGDFPIIMRIETAMFHDMLQRLTPRITKEDTNWKGAWSLDLSWQSPSAYWTAQN